MMRAALKLLFCCALFPAFLRAQVGSEVAHLDSVEGMVEVQLRGESTFHRSAIGQIFHLGDTIRTGKSSRAGIVFSSGVLLRLSSGATLQFQSGDVAAKEGLLLTEGKGYFFSRSPLEFPPITTSAVTTAVRGTEFVVSVDAEVTSVAVLNGQVECFNQFGTALLSRGEQAMTRRGFAPQKGLLLKPGDTVEWVVSYPLVIDPVELATEAGAGADVLRAIESGDYAAAIAQLSNSNSARALLLRAELYLARGELEAANSLLDQVNARAQSEQLIETIKTVEAQRAIIALARNDKAGANDWSDKVIESQALTSQQALALSYVLQANGEIDRAYSASENINQSDYRRSSRLAELALARGQTLRAFELSQADLSNNPNRSSSLTVAGFVQLTRGQIDDAVGMFEQAINADPAASVAHFGLGLAFIRKAELARGRAEIERAVYLDPSVSVYRSYLGKAFFEEEKSDLAANEYNQAIALDPNDPTAFLYRAFLKLSQNDPIAALKDTERSIALNDNRAVYRSSFLLDQDRAVRGAGLAEVFTSLGFDKAARVEAIKSINQDYTNFSAHRLLADSYQTIFLDDARITEQRITNLLAPLSFNLFAQSSATSSINEYNSLFDRVENRSAIEVSGQSSDDLLVSSAQTAGQGQHYGYAVRGLSALTGGRRHGNFSRRYQSDLLLQYEGVPEDRFVFGANSSFYEARELSASPQDVELDGYQFSLGQRHAFSPNSILLTDINLSNERNDFLDRAIESFLDLNQTIDGELLHLQDVVLLDDFSHERVQSGRAATQYVYTSQPVSIIAGAQLGGLATDRKQDAEILDDQQQIFTGLGERLRTRGENNLISADEYLYTTLHTTPWLDLHAGGNQTDLEIERREISPFLSDTYGRSHFSSKAGATLYPRDDLLMRFGYFETLRKSALEDRAELEPVLVGGINQRFTDDSASRARNLGAAVDFKIPASTYLGVEALRRHVTADIQTALAGLNLDGEQPLPQVNLDPLINDHREQQVLSAYFSQVLSDHFVSAINYDRFANDRSDPEFGDELVVNKAAAELRYFDRRGIYSFARATWRETNPGGAAPLVAQGDSFTLVDIGTGYRLPNRHGTIALQLNNIFDQQFVYDQSNGFEESVRPEMFGSIVVSLNF